jgi:hypothetical protein
VHLFKYSPIRENGIEPHVPTGPIIAHNGKKKNVANTHDVNTKNRNFNEYFNIFLTYLLSLKIVPFVEKK